MNLGVLRLVDELHSGVDAALEDVNSILEESGESR